MFNFSGFPVDFPHVFVFDSFWIFSVSSWTLGSSGFSNGFPDVLGFELLWIFSGCPFCFVLFSNSLKGNFNVQHTIKNLTKSGAEA